jgi:hypothetical protein
MLPVLSAPTVRHDKDMIRRNARIDLRADGDTSLAKRRKRLRGGKSAASRRLEQAQSRGTNLRGSVTSSEEAGTMSPIGSQIKRSDERR